MFLFNRHKHKLDLIGYYYVEDLTEATNNFDYITVYKRYKCTCPNCNYYKDIKVSSEKFLPLKWYSIENRRKEYINYLKDNNIKLEIYLEFDNNKDIK